MLKQIYLLFFVLVNGSFLNIHLFCCFKLKALCYFSVSNCSGLCHTFLTISNSLISLKLSGIALLTLPLLMYLLITFLPSVASIFLVGTFQCHFLLKVYLLPPFWSSLVPGTYLLQFSWPLVVFRRSCSMSGSLMYQITWDAYFVFCLYLLLPTPWP